MVDIVDSRTRSRMMSGIRGRHTRPERVIRSGLHAAGLRYALHASNLPGRPDLVFPRWNAIVFVHGCFWHRHDCRYFKQPATRRAFWIAKFKENRARDLRNENQLWKTGWRIAKVWECAIRDSSDAEIELVIARLAKWIRSPGRRKLELRGHE